MPRNAELNEKMKESRRAAILDAALLLFASRGLAATNVRHIAQGAGMSQGLLYHYFKNKEEIFTELVAYSYGRMKEAALGLEEMKAPADEKLKMALSRLLSNMKDKENNARQYLFTNIAAASSAIPDEAEAIIRQTRPVLYLSLEKIMIQGQQEGSLLAGDASQMAALFWATINGLAVQAALHDAHWNPPPAQYILRMFLKEPLL